MKRIKTRENRTEIGIYNCYCNFFATMRDQAIEDDDLEGYEGFLEDLPSIHVIRKALFETGNTHARGLYRDRENREFKL
jgi:hypothetical protein